MDTRVLNLTESISHISTSLRLLLMDKVLELSQRVSEGELKAVSCESFRFGS